LAEADVKALRKLERSWQDLVLQRKAASTRLQFSLAEGQSITLLGRGAPSALSGEGERMLDDRISLRLLNLGELTVTPGGQDLAELGRNCEKA